MTKTVNVTIDRFASIHEAYREGGAAGSRSFSVKARSALFAYLARQDEATVRIEMSGEKRQDRMIRELEGHGVTVEVLQRTDGAATVTTRRAA